MAGIIFWLSIGLILYTYAGYPILLGILARFKHNSKPQLSDSAKFSVTLLIAAYNESAVINRKLENCLDLEYPHDLLQIIVVADGSNDDTPEIVKQYEDKGIELLYQPERKGKMAAINRGIENAHGEIVVLSDANNLYDDDAISQLVTPFSDPQIGLVSGAKIVLDEDDPLSTTEGLYWKYESFIKKQETLLGSCLGASAEILAFRRKSYKSPPSRIINDDFYLILQTIQRGQKVVYAPKARSRECVSASSQDEVVRRSRIITGRYQALVESIGMLPWNRPVVIWQIFSHKFFRPFVAVWMIAALLANIAAVVYPPGGSSPSLLRLTYPYNWIILSFQVIFYFLAWMGNMISLPGKIGKLFYLPAYLVNSNFAAVYGLWAYLNGRQTVLWERVKRREVRQ